VVVAICLLTRILSLSRVVPPVRGRHGHPAHSYARCMGCRVCYTHSGKFVQVCFFLDVTSPRVAGAEIETPRLGRWRSFVNS
jgi:hypothetical protein